MKVKHEYGQISAGVDGDWNGGEDVSDNEQGLADVV